MELSQVTLLAFTPTQLTAHFLLRAADRQAGGRQEWRLRHFLRHLVVVDVGQCDDSSIRDHQPSGPLPRDGERRLRCVLTRGHTLDDHQTAPRQERCRSESDGSAMMVSPTPLSAGKPRDFVDRANAEIPDHSTGDLANWRETIEAAKRAGSDRS
jgi:hypothetical protein